MVASITDWSTVEFFKPEEWVKDPNRVSFELVHLVDEMRRRAGVPIIIHEAWSPDGHVKKSAHYIGLAVDLHFVGWSLLDQWLFAERFAFEGIGLYPYWNRPGLHVDLYRKSAMGRRWWRNAQGLYLSINRTLLGILLSGSERT